MKTIRLLIYLIVFAFFTNCKKKEYPLPTYSEAVTFYSKLMVNGEPLELTTGKQGYYMYSSYSIDSSNVYNLIGEFKKEGCSNCPNSLLFQINDSKISSPGGSIDIANALQVKSYEFLKGEKEMGYTISFEGTLNKTAASYYWDFGDGTTSIESNPVHQFKPGKYNVSLVITGTNQCQSSNTTSLSLTSPNDLNAFITSKTVSTTVSFTTNLIGGAAPHTFVWDFGDGTKGTAQNPTHIYGIKGGYAVKLTITDANGNKSQYYYNVVAGADQSACSANIKILSKEYTAARTGLSKSMIRFTGASGTTFTTDNEMQSPGSGIEVLAVEDFVLNENKQPTKKVKLKFNCTLYNGAKTVSLQGTEVYVGFAYK